MAKYNYYLGGSESLHLVLDWVIDNRVYIRLFHDEAGSPGLDGVNSTKGYIVNIYGEAHRKASKRSGSAYSLSLHRVVKVMDSSKVLWVADNYVEPTLYVSYHGGGHVSGNPVGWPWAVTRAGSPYATWFKTAQDADKYIAYVLGERSSMSGIKNYPALAPVGDYIKLSEHGGRSAKDIPLDRPQSLRDYIAAMTQETEPVQPAPDSPQAAPAPLDKETANLMAFLDGLDAD